LLGAGGGYGIYRALARRRSMDIGLDVGSDERPDERPEDGPPDDKAELARRMAEMGESMEAISKELGMSLREVELALKLKDR
ncbi:MAG: hypothetical protein DRP95_01565, partial [Candidatus Latescibacterota bacterium]